MINPNQLRDFVQRTLRGLETATGIPYSEHAVELLLMTAAHESHAGTYIRQQQGPALGLYQMEPATEADTHENWIKHRKEVADYMKMFAKGSLEWDLKYSTIMARIYYYRQPEALPGGVQNLAAYAKEHWNTPLGKATADDYIEDYVRYALDWQKDPC